MKLLTGLFTLLTCIGVGVYLHQLINPPELPDIQEQLQDPTTDRLSNEPAAPDIPTFEPVVRTTPEKVAAMLDSSFWQRTTPAAPASFFVWLTNNYPIILDETIVQSFSSTDNELAALSVCSTESAIPDSLFLDIDQVLLTEGYTRVASNSIAVADIQSDTSNVGNWRPLVLATNIYNSGSIKTVSYQHLEKDDVITVQYMREDCSSADRINQLFSVILYSNVSEQIATQLEIQKDLGSTDRLSSDFGPLSINAQHEQSATFNAPFFRVYATQTATGWKKIAATNDTLNCTLLDEHNFSTLLAPTCIGKGNTGEWTTLTR